jgi:hypothetical protein
MSQKQNFIKTSDKETADKLIAAGFQLVSQDGVYTFLNQVDNLNFENIDIKKIVYTNIFNF